ncbi:MAG: tyrosine--tRNA ligase, partial [Devosia sp.]
HQISDPEGLDALAMKGPITGYVGYDATATSIHIGNLITVTMLYWLQETGHKAISLMGGGTSMVGDPSFRDDQRQLLSVEKINANIESIKRVYANILRYDGANPAMMVNNADWLLKLNYVEFLRDVGRYFSVNRMLSFDSVKTRLDREQSLSFLEFNYMIMQGYDFVELNRRYDCVLQMGGTDQWGNIINGVDLSHRMGGPQLYALTTPLLTTSSGAKMGKTASGAVWLNGDLFSPYEFWQYFRNTEDADVGKFLKIFTRLPLTEIARLEALGGVELNEAKKILATEITAIVHGLAAAEQAARDAEATFGSGQTEVANWPVRYLKDDPRFPNARTVAAILAATGFVSSMTDARKQMSGGAQVRINDRIESDPEKLIGLDEVDERLGGFKVQFGKKKFALVKLAP